jgi:AcrR family transcriptional regulator
MVTEGMQDQANPLRPSNSDATRQSLILAALDRFGRNGFDATSTREIAKLAKANIAAISYHFGGKEGLRKACASHVAAFIGGVLEPMLIPIADTGDELTPSAAEQRLVAVFGGMVRYMAANAEAQPVVRFVLRELMDPGPVFEALFAGVIRPMHIRICRLWSIATGADPDSAETRIATLALIGQVMYFRIARPVVLRRLDWSDIGPDEAEALAAILSRHVSGAVRAAREERGARS